MGPIAWLVAGLTADPGLAKLFSARFHTFVEIDHELISSADLRRVVVSYKRKLVHKVQVYCLVMLAREKSELTVST